MKVRVLIPAGDGIGRHEDRGSRFLGHAFFLEEEGAFAGRLAALRAAHPRARHFPWAWRLPSGYRASDDGEPAGTAGRPILAVVEGAGLQHCGLIVVRYFGGVKLGTGGLVRAYTAAAQRAIAAAGTSSLVRRVRLHLVLPFDLLGLRDALATACPGLRWGAGTFREAGWTAVAEMPEPEQAAAEELLQERGRGRAAWTWHNPAP